MRLLLFPPFPFSFYFPEAHYTGLRHPSDIDQVGVARGVWDTRETPPRGIVACGWLCFPDPGAEYEVWRRRGARVRLWGASRLWSLTLCRIELGLLQVRSCRGWETYRAGLPIISRLGKGMVVSFAAVGRWAGCGR